MPSRAHFVIKAGEVKGIGGMSVVCPHSGGKTWEKKQESSKVNMDHRSYLICLLTVVGCRLSVESSNTYIYNSVAICMHKKMHSTAMLRPFGI